MAKNTKARPLRLPDTVRIGASDYAVEIWDPVEAGRARALGVCDPRSQVIKVREGLAPHRTAEVFMHEVLHAVYDAAALNATRSPPSEERCVAALGGMLLQVWRDNPALVTFFEGVYRPAS